MFYYVGHTHCILDTLILFAHEMLTYQSSRFADHLLHCIIKEICSCQEVDEKTDLISVLIKDYTNMDTDLDLDLGLMHVVDKGDPIWTVGESRNGGIRDEMRNQGRRWMEEFRD